MAEIEQSFEFEPAKPIKGYPELHWTGKRPYTSTQYFPAQLRERYGEEQDGWINKIYWGDNLQVMSHLLKNFRSKIDLIYIDPPFDSKADYKKKIEVRGQKAASDATSFEEKQYGDIWTNDEYLQFMYERLILMRELLSDKGSIYVHCDWHKSHYLRLLMDEVFGMDNFRNDIIWTYNGKGLANAVDNYVNYNANILFYAKSNLTSLNNRKEGVAPSVLSRFGKYLNENNQITFGTLRNSKESSELAKALKRFVKENGKQPTDADIAVDYNQGTLLKNIWDDIAIIRENNVYAEYVNYPTQKPEALLERIIKASSKPGDIVFDCFMGSGTTQAVAMKLGRRFIGADINLGAIQTTTKRLLSIAKELHGKGAAQPPLKLVRNEKRKAKTGEYEHPDYEDYQDKHITAAEARPKFTGDKSPDKDLQLSTTHYPLFTSFEVHNVNNYDFFRNPVEARDLLIEALEIQKFDNHPCYDGEKDGRMVKILPVNRIASKADVAAFAASLPYKSFELRRQEHPSAAVEKLLLVCMGHEPDLKAALEKETGGYKLDIEIVDILRDKSMLELKHEAEADIQRKGNKLVIRKFYPMNLMQKLSLEKKAVSDWRELVDSVMIDWNWGGAEMESAVIDVPEKNALVSGEYNIPKDAGTIKVKITDLLSESLELVLE